MRAAPRCLARGASGSAREIVGQAEHCRIIYDIYAGKNEFVSKPCVIRKVNISYINVYQQTYLRKSNTQSSSNRVTLEISLRTADDIDPILIFKNDKI